MTRSMTALVLHVSVTSRALLRPMLAAVSDAIDGEVLLRKARITETGARIELEVRAHREQFHSVFQALLHPRVTIHSYNVLASSPEPAEGALSAVEAVPTLPPAAAPRFRRAVPVC